MQTVPSKEEAEIMRIKKTEQNYGLLLTGNMTLEN